jgi:translocation and assembly module TamB
MIPKKPDREKPDPEEIRKPELPGPEPQNGRENGPETETEQELDDRVRARMIAGHDVVHEIGTKLKKGATRVERSLVRRFLVIAGWLSGSTGLTVIAATIALYLWASSAAFENTVRQRVIAEIEDATGGRVEIAGFHWELLHLRVEATGITIHGLEGANEAPYAHIDRLKAEAGVLGLFTMGVSPRVVLHSVEVDGPEYHLIVYSDGTTNQPHPRHPPKPGKPAMDTLFDLRVGLLTVRRGEIQIANRKLPLDFVARDASAELAWLTTMGGKPEGPGAENGVYRISFGLSDLNFAQGIFASKVKAMQGRLDASALLGRNEIELEQLRLVSMDQTLALKGNLKDFAHPVWQGAVDGRVDLRVLAPSAGFDLIRSGVVTVHGTVAGRGGEFQSQGNVATGEVHYQDPVADVHVRSLTANFKATGDQLLVSDVRAPLAQGGEVDGEFFFDQWLVDTPGGTDKAKLEYQRSHKGPMPAKARVRATLKSVTLDTVLDMLAGRQYRRLGMDAVISGPATADWSGMATDLAIGGQLALTPSAKPVAGEAPVTGFVDGVYHGELGTVDVHKLDVRLPNSSVEGSGSLGVFPIDRASAISLDVQSSDLSEFDAVLRSLELKNGSRIGTAALPARLGGAGKGAAGPAASGQVAAGLSGQMQFHGQLSNGWLTPRVEGHLSATNVGIEIPAGDSDAEPRFVSWDSLDVDGVYTPASIAIRHGVLRRGQASMTVDGRIDSSNPNFSLADRGAEFDEHSTVLVHAEAQQFPVEELLPLAGVTAPVTGKLNAKVNFQGPIDGISGSGTVDLAKATMYGEAVDRVHATGSMAGQQLKIASLTAERGAGRVSATGNYDFSKKVFQVDARGTAIEVGDFAATRQSGIAIAGKLGFTMIGSGTLDDPRLTTHATMSGMTIAGDAVADLLLTATTEKRVVRYDLSSHQTAGDFSAHGETALTGDYPTQAKLQFGKFDIGAMLKLLHVTGISGKSDLEGTAQIAGPLAHPEKMSGEASLGEVALEVEGVHLKSHGPVHAALAGGLARLDPVEITGEDTDLKLGGTLNLNGKQQLDLKASGSVNLRLAESLDPDLISSGVTSFEMEAHGPLLDPILQGKVEFKNVALALQDFPNGLSQIQGTLEFIQNRLEVRKLTAMSGGGQLSVGGYIGFQRGLYADLTATGKGIRLRYPQGISSLADASLHLQGPQNNLLLSGNVVVTRFAINSELDVAGLASQATGVQPVISPDAPSNHIRLDVWLTSAPQLNFQNAYAKLAGDVDLHLRGTIASPSLLGRISLTEGSASIGGTRYELQRGDITFSNPVRIQPNIDLDATARVEDYDITLGLHGTTDKLNVTYRSEPPLPEADVIALLAQGRTQDEQQATTQQQQQAGDNPTTELLLGGALNATVSNRVQRLFGSGAVKVDPNFIGTIGNSSARVTVVEQIGNNVTFTFASNVNTTAQQLIQAEIAVNRHVSLLLTQDESGIFSMVFKIRRRFK